MVLAAITAAASPPNLIVFLADDVGYADIGCYGNTRNRTPNLDALAAQGMRFTDFHANSSVCSPTRAALLTGRYQQRAGVETVFGLNPAEGLSPRVPTLPGYLRQAGYVTGGFGKWHLGLRPPYTPATHGFDEFCGLYTGDGDHHSRVNRSGGADWWRNEKPYEEAGYTGELITRHSLEFIGRHHDRPFFLYVAQLLAHFPWQGPGDAADRKVGGNYDGPAKFGSRADKPAAYREMIEALDRSVGQIMAKLRELGLEKNTLVFFASDNGGYNVNDGGYVAVSDNGPFRGQKWDLYEGGHRVPAIACWPGRIPAGVVSDATVMTMDLLPTCLELAGRPLPTGADAPDGVSLVAHLFHGARLPDRALCWRLGETKAVRQGDWKLVAGKGAPELYRLDKDAGEKANVAAQEPKRVQAMLAILKNWETSVDASARSLANAPVTQTSAASP